VGALKEKQGAATTAPDPDLLTITEATDLFLAHFSRIKTFAQRFTRNWDDAEDLAYDVYERFVSKKMRRDELKNVNAYLLTMTRNLALDQARHRRCVRIDYIDDMESAEAIHPSDYGGAEILGVEQELQVLMDAADLLPERMRMCFLLKKVYGASQQEIAEVMGISENTVEQHLTKAMREIRPYLSSMPSYLEEGV
jgi:RNA polymerase sigma factor (sigma-70 family)